MSWDIVLFNSKEKIISVAELNENQLKSINFCEILESTFSEIKKDENHREIIGNNFTIEFFSENENSSNFMLSIYGENGIYELIKLAKKHNWQIYDSGTDRIINLELPEQNGFESYRRYINKILKNGN
jgi:hypothetical protein